MLLIISSAARDLIDERASRPNRGEVAPLALFRGILLGGVIGVGLWLAALFTIWLLTFAPGSTGPATPL
jgi:hypothetical protein